ncbi:hypothetical protein HK104_003340, partial [Borealophlyctis nickersoniae]
WSSFTCFANTLGLTQVTVQFACFTTIVLLFYAFYPSSLARTSSGTPTPEYTRDTWVAYSLLFYFIVSTTLVVSLLFLGHDGSFESDAINIIAGAFGSVAMGAAIVQFLPQIFHTWTAKRVGALSIPMMLMQCPGSFVFVYSLASQPGTNWTSWFSFLITGTLQFVLLVLCIIYTIQEKREGVVEDKENEEDVTAPLLDGGEQNNGDAEGGSGYGAIDVGR